MSSPRPPKAKLVNPIITHFCTNFFALIRRNARFSVFDLIEILFQRLGPINKVIKDYFSLSANSSLPNLMACPVDTGEHTLGIWKENRKTFDHAL